jgi:hypothetical protein
MSDEHYWDENTLDENEIAEGMKLASQELRAWLEQGLESDLRKRGAEIAAQRRRGEYLQTREREQFAKAFQPDANPGEVAAINQRLNELYSKPSLTRAEDAERAKLTKQLEKLMRRYPNGSSKQSMDW